MIYSTYLTVFINRYKTATGSSQYRFGVLAKIVKHMRTRHQEGDMHPLTLEEILDETNQLDVGTKVKQVNNLHIVTVDLAMFYCLSGCKQKH